MEHPTSPPPREGQRVSPPPPPPPRRSLYNKGIYIPLPYYEIMEETRIFPKPIGRGPKGALFTELILFLRFIQQCALVVTLFIAIYFVYWHLNLVDPVPKAYVVLIGTTSITLFLLQLATLSHILFPTRSIIIPLKNSLLQTFLLSLGYATLFSVPGLRVEKADDWFKPIRENAGYATLKDADVEAHHATLSACLVWFGALGVATTWILAALAIWKASKMGKLTFSLPTRSRRGNYVAVGDFDDEESDASESGISKAN